jgi:hypothetical protein
MKAERAQQWMNVDCPCGSTGGAYVVHYGIVRCSCGLWYWALQPHRGGPLVCFPWPGDWQMARARAAFEKGKKL